MTVPCQGKGRFQWSTGGWFGAQIGSTAYLVVLGALLAFPSPRAGILLLVCGLLPNIIGTWIWMRRDRFAPYPALQLLGGTLFVFTALALGGLVLGSARLGLLPSSIAEARQVAWIILIYPAMMLMFHFQEREASRAKPPAGKP